MCHNALRDLADVALAPVGVAVGGISGGNAVHNVIQKKPLSTNAKTAGIIDAIGATAAGTAPGAAAGEAATSGSTAATGVTPAATQGVVGETAAGAAPGATGATSGTLSVKDAVQLAAAVAGTSAAAFSIYSAAHAPKPPGMEAPPPPPQAGVQPDFTAIRKKNLFGDDGPFARDSTFLTGAGGVPAGNTNLGRNILLGS